MKPLKYIFIYFYHCHKNTSMAASWAGETHTQIHKGRHVTERGRFQCAISQVDVATLHRVCLVSLATLTEAERFPLRVPTTQSAGRSLWETIRCGWVLRETKGPTVVFCSMLYNVEFCPTLIYFALSFTMRQDCGFCMSEFIKAKSL